ncbi:MAG: hypothetical protein ACE5HZ_09525, partial [Fidelibacterota bacterium]
MFTRPAVYYLPLLTTVVSVLFASVIFRRYREKGGGTHLLWWGGGILIYGMGTFAESWITLLGLDPVIFRFWYIVGALMGGAPLATGTVWLMLKPRSARRITAAAATAMSVSALFVIMSPVDLSILDSHLPSGKAFGWQWVRYFSPFINTYAVIFLIGGAILSAWRFRKEAIREGDPVPAGRAKDRFIGNACIAGGAILPGIGGASSRAGHTEVLYVTELVG